MKAKQVIPRELADKDVEGVVERKMISNMIVCQSLEGLLVHAKDESARRWYLNWEFEPGPSDPFHLFLLMKDIKAMVNSSH